MNPNISYSGSVALPRSSRVTPTAPLPLGTAARFSAVKFIGLFWWPLLATLLRCGPSAAGTAAYVMIAMYALAGPRQAIVSLWLCWVFNMLNHGLFPPPGSATFLRHAVVLAAFLSVFIHGRKSALRSTGFLIPVTVTMCAFLVVHSIVFSQQIDVSLLKTISFSMAAITAVLGWGGLSPTERRATDHFIWGSLVAIAILSLPLIPLPVGYFRNGEGFQGVMVHPQNFGPTLGILAVLLIATGLTARKISWGAIALVGICVLLVYLSKARIGAVAAVGGLMLGVSAEVLRRMAVRIRENNGMRLSRVLAASLGLGLTLAVAGPWIVPKISAFIDKGSRSESLTEAAIRSRGHIMDEMLEHIRDRPVVGVGFGVNPDMDYFGIARDPIFGLPIMATVEKGVMPIAVIEETGIMGAIFTYPWLLLLMRRAASRGVVAGSVCFAVLVTNLAEACLFSPGGQGMFQILLVIWAATFPAATVGSGAGVRHARVGQAARLAA